MTTDASLLAFEDFKPGHFGSYGPHKVTRAEITEFAREFDPQPMHLDEEAAKKSLLGGLAASGWHMAAIQMRLLADGFFSKAMSLGGPGIDELRWVAPLRPDTDVMADVYVLESRVSKSRPDVGFVKLRFELREAGGKVLMTQLLSGMFRKRNSGQG
jgi:acyl dehydratase